MKNNPLNILTQSESFSSYKFNAHCGKLICPIRISSVHSLSTRFSWKRGENENYVYIHIVTFQPSWCHDHAHSSRPLFLKRLNFSLYMFWLFFSTSLSIDFNHSLCRSKQQTSNQLWMLLLHHRSMKISSLKQCFTEFIFSLLCYI